MKRRSELDELFSKPPKKAAKQLGAADAAADGAAKGGRVGTKTPAAPLATGTTGKGTKGTKGISTAARPAAPAAGSFDRMGFRAELLRGFYAYGFQRPSPIQEKALAPLLSGRDIVAQAQSGTGKTALIAMASLQRSDAAVRHLQVLILSPSRELAQQIQRLVQALGDYSAVQSLSVTGGSVLSSDIAKIGRGVHILSATPGRVLDLLHRRAVAAKHLRMVVIDEADEMLAKGFREQIEKIRDVLARPGQAHAGVQMALFSATMPPEVVRLAQTLVAAGALYILVDKEKLAVSALQQYFVAVEEECFKLETLTDLYGRLSVAQSVVFVNTRARAVALAAHLRRAHFAVAAVHGELAQADRDAAMRAFRAGQARVLVATDVGARGVDVQQVQLVVNYDLPASKESYLHRIGRAGRFGRAGIAISLVTLDDMDALHALERHYKTEIAPMPATVVV